MLAPCELHELGNAAMDKRILVLGSTAHPKGVVAFPWDAVPLDLNVGDFDAVILNLVSATPARFGGTGQEPGPPNVHVPNAAHFGALLFTPGTEVICIGLPGITTKWTGGRVDWWLPIMPALTRDWHHSVDVVDPEFEFYLRHVDRYPFHVIDQMGDGPGKERFFQGVRGKSIKTVTASLRVLAQTRSGLVTAFGLTYYGNGSRDLSSGNVIWLPPPTKIGATEAVNLILSRRYGLAFERDLPEWAAYYKTPDEIPVHARMKDLEQQITTSQAELDRLNANLPHLGRWGRLLYEQHDALETIVREALEFLGAGVEPERNSREDGRLQDPRGRKAVLEIKGLVGPVKGAHARELEHWRVDATEDPDWDGIGILIANPYCGTDPVGRRTNDCFPDEAMRAAKLFRHTVLSTCQLYEAVRAKQAGTLDEDAFWDEVFSGATLPSLPSPQPDAG